MAVKDLHDRRSTIFNAVFLSGHLCLRARARTDTGRFDETPRKSSQWIEMHEAGLKCHNPKYLQRPQGLSAQGNPIACHPRPACTVSLRMTPLSQSNSMPRSSSSWCCSLGVGTSCGAFTDSTAMRLSSPTSSLLQPTLSTAIQWEARHNNCQSSVSHPHLRNLPVDGGLDAKKRQSQLRVLIVWAAQMHLNACANCKTVHL